MMMCAKLFPLSLVTLTLFGCNQSSVNTHINNVVKASTVSQQQNSFPKNTTIANQGKQSKTGKMIGPAFDCDNDGQADDARVDYDGDGIPDECVIGNQEPQVQIDLSSYKTAIASLDKLTKNCKETEKIQKYNKYTVCTINGKPVKASESNVELGDGLAYWFENGKVRAIRVLHTENLFIFDDKDNLASVFYYDFNTNKMKNVAAITDEQSNRFTLENRRDAYKKIVEIFNL